MQAEFTERRAHPRVEANIAANVTYPAARNAIAVQTHDISASGLYCWLPAHILPSTQTGIAMLLPLREGGKIRNEFVQAEGRVVRCESGEEESQPRGRHIAIHFHALSEEGRSVVEEYIRQHPSEG